MKLHLVNTHKKNETGNDELSERLGYESMDFDTDDIEFKIIHNDRFVGMITCRVPCTKGSPHGISLNTLGDIMLDCENGYLING